MFLPESGVNNVSQELKVIADFYDFMLWMVQRTEKFPRHHHYSLGIAIESGRVGTARRSAGRADTDQFRR